MHTVPTRSLAWISEAGPAPRRSQVFLLPEFLAITMEYAAGGDLFQLVGRAGGLREEDAKWYFQQIIVAIDYCHRMVRTDCLERGCCHTSAAENHIMLQKAAEKSSGSMSCLTRPNTLPCLLAVHDCSMSCCQPKLGTKCRRV